jgi:tetratricopeptide (TPR) repeat protein
MRMLPYCITLRFVCLAAILGCLPLDVVRAQQSAPPTATGAASMPQPDYPRPDLMRGADPWDAQSYLGEAWRAAARGDAKRAVAAAYWATRLDPSLPQGWLAYWQLRWLSEPKLRARLERGDAKAFRSPEVLRIDSLHLRALYRDPLASPDAGPLEPPLYAVNEAMAGARAALARDSSVVGAYLFLAKQHYKRRSFDSTVSYLQGAVRAVDRLAATRMGPVYESRELFHYAIGRALYASGDVNAARTSYAQAASEALGFAPAHAELGSIAWTNWSNLPLARQEFELALELREDAVVRFDYGTILLEAREHAAALEQFDRALALEPYYARALFNRAVALDRLNRGADAVRAYRGFLERAPRRLDTAIEAARKRLAILEETGAAPLPSVAPRR